MLIGELPKPGRKVRLSGLVGSSEALALAELARECPHVVAIARDVAAAAHLAEEIRFFAGGGARVALLPDWEVLPYERFSPPKALTSERLRTLSALANGAPGVTVLAAHTLMHPVSPPEYVGKLSFAVKAGERIDVARFVRMLSDRGYWRVERVMEPGELAVHGGQVDVFPPGSPLPVRIVLDDDEIEQLRLFDPDSQRSLERRESVEVLPASEYPLDEEGRERFCRDFLGHGGDFTADSDAYSAVRKGEAFGGIEFFLPLFFGRSPMLAEHFREETVVFYHHELAERLESGMADAAARYESVSRFEARPALPPRDLFHGPEQALGSLKPFRRIELLPAGSPRTRGCAVSPLPRLELKARAEKPFERLEEYLWTRDSALVALSSEGRLDLVAEGLDGATLARAADYADYRAQGPGRFGVAAPLREGFVLDGSGEAFVTEFEIYRMHAPLPRRKAHRFRHPAEALLAVEDIRDGDPVVHRRHGIGIYRGLTLVEEDGQEEEFIVVEYADRAKLMIPVGDLHMIGRYIGGSPEAEIQVDRLGSPKWEKRRSKAKKRAHDLAAQLIEIYSRRQMRKGFRHSIPAKEYAAFVARFPYPETADQRAAINEVLADMQLDRPMDRLVCGEVGFGKTEVALRAAFVAAANGRQVAVLSPTTILASQHHEVFSDRFSGTPYRVAELSRLRTPKQIAETAEQIAAGEVSVAVGTHQLLQPGFRFRDLGLLVIDEEHRFGVRQKERLKSLRGDLEVLAMTATPIPRTLSMALEGISDFSQISTAPEGRAKTMTFVGEYRRDLVVDAIRREAMRGGQAFYVHNDVASMEDAVGRLEEWMPEVRFEYAHGKMAKPQLERVVRRFYRHECDVLVTTTIVELGIDIPNANTVVIERADRFGLAQLHQLRGRVGRSHRQAYAYLLTDGELKSGTPAHARLGAIRFAGDQGGGFGLALRDLEIRGAGDVLGEAQSGQIEAVGYTMYRQMIEASVRALRREEGGARPGGDEPDGIEVEVDEACLLPDDYCPSVNERFRLYRRLSMSRTEGDLALLADEIADRFGPLPEAAELLVETHRMRIGLLGKAIRGVRVGKRSATVAFAPDAPYSERIVELAQRGEIRLAGSEEVSVPLGDGSMGERLRRLGDFVDGLCARPVAAAEGMARQAPASSAR